MWNGTLSVACADEQSEIAVSDEVVKGVLCEFEEMCSVPHGTGNEWELARRFQQRFLDMGFKSHIDDICNLVCDIPASEGCENAPLLMVQGHLDMVCAVRSGSDYNPLTDNIQIIVLQDKETGRPVLCSKGDSSLGADCGLGVSAAMWALFGKPTGTAVSDLQVAEVANSDEPAESPGKGMDSEMGGVGNRKAEVGGGSNSSVYGKPVHGPVRIVLTAQEEIGLVGAMQMDASVLDDVDYVINVDGFACGRFVAGSAGGMRKTYARKGMFITLEEWIWEDMGRSGEIACGEIDLDTILTAVKISLSGFRGGHSGYDIDKGRANVIKLAGELLQDLKGEGIDFALAGFNGGLKHNVIPGFTEIVTVLHKDDVEKFEKCADKLSRMINEKYSETDGEGVFSYEETALPQQVVDRESAQALIDFVSGVFNGVYKYMEELPQVVDTSSNLGKVVCGSGEEQIQAEIFHRSMDAVFCSEVVEQREKCAADTGFELIDFEEYKPWIFDSQNPLLKMSLESYESVTGEKGETAVVHVGLEPSVFGEMKSGLPMICMGADVIDAHTIHERVYIDSIKPFALTLKDVIQKIAAMNR